MPDSFIPYSTDPTTVGRRAGTKKHVQTRDGATSVDIHHDQVIPIDNRDRTGIYYCHTGAHVIAATAQVLPAGFWWMFNPIASTVIAAIRAIRFSSQMGSALAAPTSPRLVVQKFSSTTNGSGALITAVKNRAAYPNPQVQVYSANTGLTFTQIGAIRAFLPIASATAVAYAGAVVADYEPEGDGMPILEAGQGLLLYQPDAGTTGDTRRFITNLVWEEFTEF